MIRFPTFRTGATISVLAACVVSAAAITTATPAAARVDISIGFNAGGISFGYFHNNLNRGQWIHHPRWGDVWRPPHARSYRPYTNGYFEYTDYGLLWIGSDPWSDITDHYGRWVYDPHYGPLWIPGYVWAPAWVIFREGNGYIGWFPMPPDYGDFDDGPYFGGSYSWDDYYGYGDWYGLKGDAFYGLWTFVDENHFYRHDYRKYAVDRSRVRSIIMHTNDTTHYATSGDHIVNRSFSADQLERVTHQHIRSVEAKQVWKSNVPMAPVSAGHNLANQEGSGRPGHNLHDRNFRSMNAPAGNENVPNNGRPGHERMNGPGATPAPQPLPNAAPSPQPLPNAGGEENGRGRRGGKNEAAPTPQPLPNAAPSPQPLPKAGGEERGQHGGKNEAAPTPQSEPTAAPSPPPLPKAGGEERGRGGKNEAVPTPQSEPTAAPSPPPLPKKGGEERGRGRHGGNPESQASPAASPEQQGQPPEGKKKENKPANPDEEKNKHPDNENGPGR